MTPTPLPSWLDRHEFPFAPALIPLEGDETLSVTDVGSGRALVFSHGTPTWSYEWRHHLRALSQGQRCIAPDHLGFGLSPRPRDADYRPEAHARRFLLLLDALGLDRYGLVLHDYGGPFALDAALDHPERLERIVLYNTFAWPFDDPPSRKRTAALAGSGAFRLLYRHLNFSFVIAKSAWGRTKKASKDTWRPYLSVFPDKDARELVLFALARSLAGAADFFASLEQRLDRLAQVPVHIIWGLEDSAFPPRDLARFRAALPQASVLELAEAGHWPHEEQPDVCVASVQEFLART